MSSRHQHLSGRGVDVINPEGRDIFLHDHGNHPYAGSEKIVGGVLRMRGSDPTFALDPEQDRVEGPGRNRHLIVADISVSAVEGAGVLLIGWVVEIVDRYLLGVGPCLTR